MIFYRTATSSPFAFLMNKRKKGQIISLVLELAGYTRRCVLAK